jgi:hypothetical protein
MVGSFSGPGFNLIFRPHTDKNPKDKPKDLDLPGKDLLELNLTHELWTFPSVKGDLGNIPNRVAEPGDAEIADKKTRKDVFLRGILYTQLVRDVTATSGALKGKRIPVNRLGRNPDEELQKQVQDIHFEPGLFIHVPDSTPVSDQQTICRMASIPHGTTINAQGLAAVKVEKVDGTLTSPPDIKVSKDLDASRPFTLDNGTIVPFDKDQFNLNTTPEKKKKDATRLPQDLEPFFKLDSFESITRHRAKFRFSRGQDSGSGKVRGRGHTDSIFTDCGSDLQWIGLAAHLRSDHHPGSSSLGQFREESRPSCSEWLIWIDDVVFVSSYLSEFILFFLWPIFFLAGVDRKHN